MKKILTLVFSAILLLAGCDDKNNMMYVDHTPPQVPKGVYVISGDEYAEIDWNANRESDLSGYNIYSSSKYDGKYTLVGSTASTYFIDRSVRNGQKYFYAVTAYDYNGNESELSYESAYAAPRPEGFNQSVFDYRKFPATAGYDFSAYAVTAYNSQSTDFYFENYNGQYFLDVFQDCDIKDMGPTTDIYDIEYAPSSGWSSTKDAVATAGHTYVIWTWDNHFAKIRIKSLTAERIVFDWSYQLIAGEITLRPSGQGGGESARRVNPARETR